MKKIILLVASFLFLVAGIAQANYFQLPSQSATPVTIYDPGNPNLSTSAALWNVKFGSSKTQYQALCVDYGTIIPGKEYDTYKMIALPNEAAYQQAAYILAHYGSVDGAVAQIAAWEVVFEGKSSGVVDSVKQTNDSNEKFYVKSGMTEAQLDLANTYVAAAVANYGNFDTSGYRLIVSPINGEYYGKNEQDFIVHVPEPFTLLLLGIGMLGLAGVRRKFQK